MKMDHPYLFSVLFIPLVYSKFVYRTPELREDYDFIIVGGGTSGCVLANRLSEDEGTTVLMIEAGDSPTGLTEVPVFAPLLQYTPEEWGYITVPQEDAFFGYINQVTPLTRYRAVGGCSDHNFMLYGRGNQRDYNEWAKNGAVGWSWNDVFPYFMKSEDQTDPSLWNDGYHGVGGYQTISALRYISNGGRALYKSGKSLGLKPGDYNGLTQNVISFMQTFQRDGRRCSNEKSFLRPVADRDNLDILTNAYVTKINIDVVNGDKIARSVTFDHNNETKTVSASKEIIMCAGVIGTPHLLLISGIGPRCHLEEMGIPCIMDLPVGENFQDQVSTHGHHYKVNDSTGIVFATISTPENVGRFMDGEGPFTSTCSVEVTGYVNTKYQDPSENWPDIQMYALSTFFANNPERMIPEVAAQFVPHINDNAMTIFPVLIRSKSRGYVKLRTTDIHDHPIINPRYLSEKDDVDRLIDAMKLADSWVKDEEFQRLKPERITFQLPNCTNATVGSDEYYKCLILFVPGSIYHPCCTCKMGDVKDCSTVVDPELRVKGIKRLRIVDASVMPRIVSSGTNAPCMMIAEKAAVMIRESYA